MSHRNHMLAAIRGEETTLPPGLRAWTYGISPAAPAVIYLLN
jgi:hypothetical protein